MLKINFNNLVRQLLPPLKRQSARLSLLQALVSPLVRLFNEFVAFRDNQRMLVNVYGSRFVLEGFLCDKYGSNNIHIRTSSSIVQRIGLRAEGRNSMVVVGLRDESDRFTVLLRGELLQNILDVDFVAYIPADVDLDAVIGDIEQYKAHYATYQVVADYYLTDSENNILTDNNENRIIL